MSVWRIYKDDQSIMSYSREHRAQDALEIYLGNSIVQRGASVEPTDTLLGYEGRIVYKVTYPDKDAEIYEIREEQS